MREIVCKYLLIIWSALSGKRADTLFDDTTGQICGLGSTLEIWGWRRFKGCHSLNASEFAKYRHN
jgi:hypothetical protein